MVQRAWWAFKLGLTPKLLVPTSKQWHSQLPTSSFANWRLPFILSIARKCIRLLLHVTSGQRHAPFHPFSLPSPRRSSPLSRWHRACPLHLYLTTSLSHQYAQLAQLSTHFRFKILLQNGLKGQRSAPLSYLSPRILRLHCSLLYIWQSVRLRVVVEGWGQKKRRKRRKPQSLPLWKRKVHLRLVNLFLLVNNLNICTLRILHLGILI